MKTAVTISMDDDLIRELRNKKVNISGTINAYFRDYLKPKKVNIEEEQKKLAVMEFGKQFNMSKELSVYTYDNLNLDATGIWQHVKNNFEPDFNLFDYIEIRNKFRAKFPEQKK